MNSKEYRELQKRQGELEALFVDFEIAIDRDPTSAELDKIAAFKLLMHAEIETFIEDRILRTLDECVNRWIEEKAVSRCLLNLVLRWSDSSPEKDRSRDVYDDTYLNELVRRYQKRAHDEIVGNNSIKQDAFSRMCFLAGLTVHDLDNALLAELESFGKTRGEVAHKGAGKVRVLNAPSVEAQSAQNIVSLLGQFDIDLALVVPAPRPSA